MAKTLHTIFSLLPFFVFAIAQPSYITENANASTLGLGKENLTHLHFYFHDIITAKNPTSVRVAKADSITNSSTMFSQVFVIDDALTVGPELSSKLVGKAQGIFASASQTEVALLMTLNFYFTEGKFNGSTLSIFGRNAIFNTVREFPIIGGTGAFRFARGYAQARTHTFDPKTLNAVVEYNVYVFHYY